MFLIFSLIFPIDQIKTEFWVNKHINNLKKNIKDLSTCTVSHAVAQFHTPPDRRQTAPKCFCGTPLVRVHN
jgi:hypothetical protein